MFAPSGSRLIFSGSGFVWRKRPRSNGITTLIKDNWLTVKLTVVGGIDLGICWPARCGWPSHHSPCLRAQEDTRHFVQVLTPGSEVNSVSPRPIQEKNHGLLFIIATIPVRFTIFFSKLKMSYYLLFWEISRSSCNLKTVHRSGFSHKDIEPRALQGICTGR